MILKTKSADILISMSFMFNCHDISNPKMYVQLGDITGQSNYPSSWSRGFSFESDRVNQTVGIHCDNGRLLEISVNVSVAPVQMVENISIQHFSKMK